METIDNVRLAFCHTGCVRRGLLLDRVFRSAGVSVSKAFWGVLPFNTAGPG